jgi:hypothetical protein
MTVARLPNPMLLVHALGATHTRGGHHGFRATNEHSKPMKKQLEPSKDAKLWVNESLVKIMDQFD